MERQPITAFETSDSLMAAIAGEVSGLLKDAVGERGRAGLLCAGGSTPAPLYARLSDASLDWTRITVGLTDERWVDPLSPGSNESFLRSTLLKPTARACAARFLPMVTDPDLPPSGQAGHVNAYYRPVTRAADCIILGMGTDGHTLSWFPRAEGTAAALDPLCLEDIVAIEAVQSPATGSYARRMTLTLPVILRARHVFLLMTGGEKRSVYETADDETPVAALSRTAPGRLKACWCP